MHNKTIERNKCTSFKKTNYEFKEEITMYTNFKVKEGKVYFNKEKGKKLISTYIGSDFNIVGYRVNMDTDEILVKVQIFSIMTGKAVVFELNRVTMTAKQLKEGIKSAFGNVLDEKHMYEFFQEKETSLMECQSLLEKENSYLTIYDVFKDLYKKDINDIYNVTKSNAEREFVHTCLGWKNIDGKLIFQGAESYGGDNISIYIGKENIQPVGNFKEIEKLYADIVEKNPYLQLTSAMGVSATILGFVNNRWGLALPNPIYSLAGTTTEGKSTAIELAVSMGGYSDYRANNSMFHTFNETINAIVKGLGDNNGFPIAFDDTKTADKNTKKRIQELLYVLAVGSDKKRVGVYGNGFQSRASAETAVMISGEDSIFSFVKEIGGLQVRVLEFWDAKWTTDATEAEAIVKFIRKNYGHITPKVAKYLLDIMDKPEEKNLEKAFTTWRNKFIKYAKKENYYNPLTERTTRLLALLMISLDILSKIIKIKFNYNEVFNILCEHIIKNSYYEEDKDELANKGYDLFRDFYINNKELLENKEVCGAFGGTASNYKGAILKKPKEVTFEILDTTITSSHCLGINKLQAEKILVKEGHLPSVKAVMTALRKKGALCTKSSGKNIRNDSNVFIIGDEQVIGGFQIYMPHEVYQDEQDIDDETGEGKIKKLY